MANNLLIVHIPDEQPHDLHHQPTADSVFASGIDPKHANQIVRRLNQIAPLEDLRHVKRIRKKVLEGEFVSAAKSDNETQFVEVDKVELAQVIYPDIKPADHFLGFVKSKPERYTAYGGAFTMNKILEFLENNKFPLVTKLIEMNSMSTPAQSSFRSLLFPSLL